MHGSTFSPEWREALPASWIFFPFAMGSDPLSEGLPPRNLTTISGNGVGDTFFLGLCLFPPSFTPSTGLDSQPFVDPPSFEGSAVVPLPGPCLRNLCAAALLKSPSSFISDLGSAGFFPRGLSHAPDERRPGTVVLEQSLILAHYH